MEMGTITDTWKGRKELIQKTVMHVNIFIDFGGMTFGGTTHAQIVCSSNIWLPEKVKEELLMFKNYFPV